MNIRCGIRLKPFINFIADKNLTLAMALGTGWKDTALVNSFSFSFVSHPTMIYMYIKCTCRFVTKMYITISSS